VLAGRARFAGIAGAPTSAIAPSRRLYAGGGGSVRGYAYKGIGPHNSEGDPTGGRSLAEFSLEARVRTGWFDGALGVVPFIDAGTVGESATPDFDEIKFGAGIGLRYYTGFGPLRLDVAMPLNRGPGDPRIGVYVALGQSF
jgi:translocation and assembly module TamA